MLVAQGTSRLPLALVAFLAVVPTLGGSNRQRGEDRVAKANAPLRLARYEQREQFRPDGEQDGRVSFDQPTVSAVLTTRS
jgi:hypothetical protein